MHIAETGHGASYYYSMLINKSGYKFTSALKIQWERDLGTIFKEDEWDKIMGVTKEVSSDIRIRLIQFRLFH